jgi:hypothetical protein
MRALTFVFVIGLAVATTADGALAQNTLLLGRGQPPRQTTVPLTTNPNYGNRPSGQFFAPAQPEAYRMPNGRYTVVTPSPLAPATDAPSTVWPVIDEGGRTESRLDSAATQHIFCGDAVCYE